MKNSKNTDIGIDKSLLLEAQKGDHRAFTKLVRQYEDLVFNFSFKVCRNKEKAEETLQDTFINVYKKLKQFDGKSKFSTWLYSIVVNNCLMKRRRGKVDSASVPLDSTLFGFSDDSKMQGVTDVHQLPVWNDTPIQKVMNTELKNLLDKAILKLPMDYRIVFMLRDIEGLSAEETGKVLKLSIPAVKSRLHRARAFLRKQLNEYMTS